MLTYRLHLVRHGMTSGNRDGRYVGRTDMPLCDEGRQALLQLKARYRYPEVEEVYTSPLSRCRQTAEILFPDAPLTVVGDLVELSLGDFEGRLISDLSDDPAYKAWIEDSSKNSPPNALEDAQGFAERVTRALNDIITDMSRRRITEAACVTHGGVLMGLLSAYAYPRRHASQWAIANGAGYTVSTDAALWMRDRALEVVSELPEGFSSGADPRVMRSLGIK